MYKFNFFVFLPVSSEIQKISFKCANDTIFFDNYERYHPMTSPIYNGIITHYNIAQPPYIYGYQTNFGGVLSNSLAGTNFYPSSGFNQYDRFNPGYQGFGGGYNNYDRNRYIGDGSVYGNRYGSYGSGQIVDFNFDLVFYLNSIHFTLKSGYGVGYPGKFQLIIEL